MKNKKALLVIVPFFAILLIFFALSFMDSDKDYSAEEVRTLAQFPMMDLNQPQYITSSINDYVTDQFPYRSFFVKMYTIFELQQGKKDIRDIYVADDQWLFPKTYLADFTQLTGHVIKASLTYPDVTFCYAILPVKNYCLPDLDNYQYDTASAENLAILQNIFKGHRVQVIDVADYMRNSFSTAEKEQQWYKTDYHWNASGAASAAEYIIDQMFQAKIISAPLDQSRLQFNNIDALYQGDLNRRFSNQFSMHENIVTVSAIDCENYRYYLSADDSQPVARNTIIGSANDGDVVDYNGIYTYNIAYYRVVNSDAPEKKTLVIFKDSLQNPTTDVFSSVFEQVVVIDARNKEAVTFANVMKNADIVLFMLHQNNPASETEAFIK